MKIRMSKITAAALAGLLFVAGVTRAQQVVEQIPDDALIVLKVKNLDATSKKIGKTMTDLGLAQMAPGMDNPLAFAEEQFNMKQGIRADGDFAIVYRDPQKTNESPDKSIIVLIPVSDYAAFVGNFDGAKPNGEITKVQMPHGGGDGFIAQWGKFAAVSPSQTVLGHKPTEPLKITGAATNRELAGRDVVMFINMAGLRPQAQGGLALARMQAGALEDSLPPDESIQRLAPVLRVFVNQVLGAADAFVRDADDLTFSVNIGDDGINGAAMADFRADSYVGSIVSSLKNTEAPLLKGLPLAKYMFLAGYQNQPEVTTKLLGDFSAPIIKEIDALGGDLKPAHDYFDALQTYLKAVNYNSFGMIAPTGALGHESILQVVSTAEGDVKAMKESQIKMIQSQQDLMKSLKLPGSEAYNMTVTPNGKTVAGVSFDLITSAMNANANDPASRRAQQAMAYMYGPNGMQIVDGEAGGRFMVGVGLSDEQITTLVEAAKSGAAPMSDSASIKAVTPRLPAKRILEAYIPLDVVANTALTYMANFGAGMNITIPADLPPIGLSISADGPSYRIESYVPTELVKQMVQAGTQAFQTMHGHRPGAGAPDADKTGDDKDKDKGN